MSRKVWWATRPKFALPGEWTSTQFRKRHIGKAWGPSAETTLGRSATLEFTLADVSKHSKEAKSGQTFFIPAEAHSLTNVGKSVVKLVSTELKESAPTGALSAAERSELLELAVLGLLHGQPADKGLRGGKADRGHALAPSRTLSQRAARRA